jgi:hypothetical protein
MQPEGDKRGGRSPDGTSRGRVVAGVVAAALLGAGIAWLDSRPTWDDTAITAVALVTVSFVVSFVAGRRPWLTALLIGGPTPLVELGAGGNPAALAALVFAGVGATLGWLVARTRAETEPG